MWSHDVPHCYVHCFKGVDKTASLELLLLAVHTMEVVKSHNTGLASAIQRVQTTHQKVCKGSCSQ